MFLENQQKNDGNHAKGGYFRSRIDGVVVCGGGPVGLAAASALRQRGEEVTILERRPKEKHTTYASEESSFNFTLVSQSVAFLESLDTPVRDLSIEVDSRQFWHGNRVTVHPYGLRETDRLYSMPRAALVCLLREQAEALGVKVLDSMTVVSLDAKRGCLAVKAPDGALFDITANKVIVADGANSRLREDIARQADTSYFREPDGYCYLTFCIDATSIRRAQLPTNRIHFVPGTHGIDIALPNRDGTMALILERTDKLGLSRVTSAGDAQLFLNGCAPVLRELVTHMDEQLYASPIRRFKYVRCGLWSFGKAIMMGDAARCCPPYTGQGLNSGLRDLASLLAAMKTTDHDWVQSARLYELERRDHCRRVEALTKEHGRKLHSRQFGGTSWRMRDRAERLAERLFGYRSAYQRVVFDTAFPTEDTMRELAVST